MALTTRRTSIDVAVVAVVAVVVLLGLSLGVRVIEPVSLVLAVLAAGVAAVLLWEQRMRHRRLRQAVADALEQASVEHEQRQRIFDALEQGVALSTLEGEVLLLNGAGQRLLGYDAAELTELYRSGRWTTYREDGSVLPAKERPIGRTIAMGKAVRDTTVVWHTKTGSPVTLRVVAQPVRDTTGALTGVVTVFSDITAEQSIARELQTTQARFEALVEQSTDIICLLDEAGTLTYASPAAERLLGFTPEAFVGRRFLEFLHPDDAGAVVEAYHALLLSPGGVASLETRIATAAGEWRQMEVVSTNRLDDPAVRGIVANVRDVTERAEAAARLTWQAFHDPLTGLANRALLLDRLGHALDRSTRSELVTALMFIDLDGFKDINDSLGHEAGDQLLIEVAGRLSSLVRAGDTVARLGGDEFIVLAESLEAPEEATAIAARINELLGRPLTIGGTELSVTASIGVAFDFDHEPDRLLREADNALYRAKALGKHRYEVFGAEQTSRTDERPEVLAVP